MSIAGDIRTNVLAIVAVYRKATGLSLATVSARFYGNAGFLKEFKAGRQTISISKLDAMIEKFSAEWPADADWPLLRTIFFERPTRRAERG